MESWVEVNGSHGRLVLEGGQHPMPRPRHLVFVVDANLGLDLKSLMGVVAASEHKETKVSLVLFDDSAEVVLREVSLDRAVIPRVHQARQSMTKVDLFDAVRTTAQVLQSADRRRPVVVFMATNGVVSSGPPMDAVQELFRATLEKWPPGMIQVHVGGLLEEADSASLEALVLGGSVCLADGGPGGLLHEIVTTLGRQVIATDVVFELVTDEGRQVVETFKFARVMSCERLEVQFDVPAASVAWVQRLFPDGSVEAQRLCDSGQQQQQQRPANRATELLMDEFMAQNRHTVALDSKTVCARHISSIRELKAALQVGKLVPDPRVDTVVVWSTGQRKAFALHRRRLAMPCCARAAPNTGRHALPDGHSWCNSPWSYSGDIALLPVIVEH